MRTGDLFRYALCNVLRGKLRSVLTILSIAIGVASVVLVLTIGDGGREAVTEELNSIGLDGIVIYPKQAAVAQGVILTDQDAIGIQNNVRSVNVAMPCMVRYGSFRMRNWQGNALIYGIDVSMKEILNVDLKYGRLPNQTDIRSSRAVAVISEGFARTVYNRSNIVGKKIRLYVGTSSNEFEVIGVISSLDGTLVNLVGEALPEFVYIPYTTAMVLAGEECIDQIIVQSDYEKAGENTLRYLDQKYGQDLFKYENINGIRDKFDEVLMLLALFIGAIASISVVVAGIGIMNTMISAGIERKYEIGIYRTLGATAKNILWSFLVESAFISALGGALGILIVFLTLIPVRQFTGIDFVLDSLHIGLGILLSAGFGVVFGVVPALRAAALNPIDAIRAE